MPLKSNLFDCSLSLKQVEQELRVHGLQPIYSFCYEGGFGFQGKVTFASKLMDRVETEGQEGFLDAESCDQSRTAVEESLTRRDRVVISSFCERTVEYFRFRILHIDKPRPAPRS